MKKTTKTVMAFLTAMTMTMGAMGVTAYAEEANTAVVTESIQTDGVFSMGAEYHFIKGSDTLILDGEGSFTSEEFDEVAKQFSPRAIMFGDNVEVPNGEWLKGILSMTSPYTVYAHRKCKMNEARGEMVEGLYSEASAQGITFDVPYFLYYMYQPIELEKYWDYYSWFEYDQCVVEKGNEMEHYLIEKGINENTAKRTATCYMSGLNCRIQIGLENPDAKSIANPDGTEINDETTEYILWKCLHTAECVQSLINKSEKNNVLDNEVSRFLADNGIIGGLNTGITVMYINGSWDALSVNCGLVHYEEDEDDDEDYEEKNAETIEEVTEYHNDDSVNVKIPDDATTLKGDADVNNEVGLSDVITVAKYNLNNELYPLANETAFANADMNSDGEVNGVDTSALIENQLGK